METSGFFNAEILADGSYDRIYIAEQFAKYFSRFIGNGVFITPASQLKVIPKAGEMGVLISIGDAYINGYWYQNDAVIAKKLSNASGANSRIDRIVLRWDSSTRTIYSAVLQGTPAALPEAPAVTRTADIYELALADILIGKAITEIKEENITDLRNNSNLCGYVKGVVDQIDTTDLFSQFTASFNSWFADLKAKGDARYNDFDQALQQYSAAFDVWFTNIKKKGDDRYNEFDQLLDQYSNEFNVWFDSVKGQLDADAATKLTKAVTELNTRVDNVDTRLSFNSTKSKRITDSLEAHMLVSNATRNLLNPSLATTTKDGITCTNNGDGTYTLNGTATKAVTLYIAGSPVENTVGGYKLLGCPINGGDDTYRIVVSYYDNSEWKAEGSDIGNGVIIDSTYSRLNYLIKVESGTTVNNLVFKPMITTDLSATYDDFVPYSGYDIKTCGKNLLDLKNKGKDTYTNAGITYTKQSDGSYKRKGTATSTPGNIWLFGGYKIVPNGTNHLLTLKKGRTYFVFDCVLFSMVNGMEWVANNPSQTPGVHTITPLQDTYITGVRDYGIGKDNTYNDIVYPRVFEADHDLGWSPYTESTIHIDSSTEFPLLGLKSFDGETNIISPGNVEVTYATSKSGVDTLNSLYETDTRVKANEDSLVAKASKSKVLSYTLSKSGWSGSAKPFTFTLNNVTGVTDSNNVELVVPSDISIEQIESYQSAAIATGTQAVDSITLKAYGEKPTIDLPITIIVRGD